MPTDRDNIKNRVPQTLVQVFRNFYIQTDDVLVKDCIAVQNGDDRLFDWVGIGAFAFRLEGCLLLEGEGREAENLDSVAG
jgi:hypothetical protein